MSTMEKPVDTSDDTTDISDGSSVDQTAETNEDMFSRSQMDSEINKAIQANIQKSNEARELELETEKALAEQKRLEVAGEHKELYERKKVELDTLKAENKRNKFLLEGNALLASKGLSDHADILTDGIDSIEALGIKADKFQSAISAGIESGINKKLGHKTTIPVNGINVQHKSKSDFSAEERTEFINKNGGEAYRKLPT